MSLTSYDERMTGHRTLLQFVSFSGVYVDPLWKANTSPSVGLVQLAILFPKSLFPTSTEDLVTVTVTVTVTMTKGEEEKKQEKKKKQVMISRSEQGIVDVVVGLLLIEDMSHVAIDGMLVWPQKDSGGSY
jgi:hypothetical protein